MKSTKILGTKIDFLTKEEIEKEIKNKKRGYYTFINTNTLVESLENKELKDSLQNSKIAFPDGFPLATIARFRGIKIANKYGGPDFIAEFISQFNKKKQKVFLYGGFEENRKHTLAFIKNKYPLIKFTQFIEGEEKNLIKRIIKEKPRIILVSIGSPKQEIWAYKNSKSIYGKIFCIGAAIPYIKGEYKRAPKWMIKSNLEWLYRLIREPKRLWKRYLVNAPKFVIAFFTNFFTNEKDK